MKFKEIKSKTYKKYEGKVYDLTVKDAHSYNIDGLYVHNSGAGSLVNNFLGITKVDPLQYALIFERFLNKDRGHLPDIDSDFCINRGPEVFQHIIDKYGREHVANVAAFTKMQMKAVIKNIAKAFDIPFAEVNEFTKNIPEKDANGENIKHIDNLESLPGATEFFRKYPDVLKYAKQIEGNPTAISQHPAGIGIVPCDITDMMPVQLAKPNGDNEPGLKSQFEKDQFEQAGVVKFDILKLKAATQLAAMIDNINIHYKDYVNKHFDGKLTEEKIPLNNEKAWSLFQTFTTYGIFQFETHIAEPVLLKMKPANMEELAAATSFIRPGASGVDGYVATKENPKNRVYLDPRLDKWLDQTYGSVVFQEQIMALISEVLGISFGQADIYRRAMEKPKKLPDQYKKFNDSLEPEGIKNGFSKDVISKVRQLIIDNSGYAFNKSHAVCYSYVSYWQAWIKANFPLVWYCCMLNDDFSKLSNYIDETKKVGINILPPSVSESKFEATISSITENSLRLGFNAIKGIGSAAEKSLVEFQPYDSLNNFFDTAGKSRAVNSKVLDALINAGAFNELEIVIDESAPKNVKTTKLTRPQMRMLKKYMAEMSGSKAIPNYAIPSTMIKNRFKEDTDLVFESDGSLIVPETVLSDFKIGLEDVIELRTKKRPKGRLKKEKSSSKLPVYLRAFYSHYDEIISQTEQKLDAYMQELNEFGYSLMKHPLDWKKKDIVLYSSVDDGCMIVEAGIVSSLIERSTKKGKKFYWVNILTPYEEIRITVWNEQFNKYNRFFQVGKMIWVSGEKGYGGMSLAKIGDATDFAYKK